MSSAVAFRAYEANTAWLFSEPGLTLRAKGAGAPGVGDSSVFQSADSILLASPNLGIAQDIDSALAPYLPDLTAAVNPLIEAAGLDPASATVEDILAIPGLGDELVSASKGAIAHLFVPFGARTATAPAGAFVLADNIADETEDEGEDDYRADVADFDATNHVMGGNYVRASAYSRNPAGGHDQGYQPGDPDLPGNPTDDPSGYTVPTIYCSGVPWLRGAAHTRKGPRENC